MPSSFHPDRLENVRLADPSRSTAETARRVGSDLSNVDQAPAPEAAHQRRASAGALTTPTVGTPSSSNAIRVAQIGTPRTKFLVPSIGSTTHWRPVN